MCRQHNQQQHFPNNRRAAAVMAPKYSPQRQLGQLQLHLQLQLQLQLQLKQQPTRRRRQLLLIQRLLLSSHPAQPWQVCNWPIGLIYS